VKTPTRFIRNLFFTTASLTTSLLMASGGALAEVENTAGKEISLKGTKGGAAACIACHGQNGEGQPANAWPRLANLPQSYLAEQIKNYQTGARINAVMAPIAKALSESETQSVSEYFQNLKMPPYAKAVGAKPSTLVLKRGRQLAEVGDQNLKLQACANCHGPGGSGLAPAIPYLGGQNSIYIESQLQSWKNGSRKTSPEHMGYIANLVDDKDIKALAAYFQQVPSSSVKKGNTK
jgi:cytochrome c553